MSKADFYEEDIWNNGDFIVEIKSSEIKSIRAFSFLYGACAMAAVALSGMGLYYLL